MSSLVNPSRNPEEQRVRFGAVSRRFIAEDRIRPYSGCPLLSIPDRKSMGGNPHMIDQARSRPSFIWLSVPGTIYYHGIHGTYCRRQTVDSGSVA